MARHLEKTENGFKEVIYDFTQCRWLYDDVCCNDKCDMVAYMPTPTLYCKKCQYFEKEKK